MQPEPLIECKYGWGRVLRLYQDCLDLHGTSHALSELIFVRPIYRQVLGVSSACIELRFRRKKIVIRGIASLEDAQNIVTHLKNACAAISSLNCSAPAAPLLALPQKSSEQSSPVSDHGPTSAPQTSPTGEASEASQGLNWQNVYYTIDNGEVETLGDSLSAMHDSLPRLNPLALRSLVDWQQSAYVSRELSEAPISPDAITVSIPVVAPNWRRERQLVRGRRRRRLKPPRSNQTNDFDSRQLALQLQQPELPHIAVPTRLLPGEHAYYRTDVTLCRELPGEPTTSRYLAKDYGSLIFTNRRLLC